MLQLRVNTLVYCCSFLLGCGDNEQGQRPEDSVEGAGGNSGGQSDSGQAGEAGQAGSATGIGGDGSGGIGAADCQPETGRFSFSTPRFEDDGSGRRDGSWDCSLRAQELEGVMMLFHLDCTEGGELVSVDLSRIALSFDGIPLPDFSAFSNGMSLLLNFSVSTNPWVENQWVRMTREDGQVMFEGYRWVGSGRSIEEAPLEVTFEAGPCPAYVAQERTTVPMSARVELGEQSTLFTMPGGQRLSDYLFWIGPLHNFEYPDPPGTPADAPLGEYCLGYMFEPEA